MTDNVFDDEIPEALAGERLDRVVSLLAGVSRAEATGLIDAGGVALDGNTTSSGKIRLAAGQRLVVDTSLLPQVPLPGPDESVPVRVVHLDEHLLVIDKEPGIVVHPGAGNADGTLVNGVLARFPEISTVGDPTRPGIVHRLDAGTSGLLVVARTQVAYEGLVDLLSRHEVERRYVALVWGVPDSPNGTIDAPIGRDPRDPLRMAVVASGKEARTHYRVVRRYEQPVVSLLECELETGRTHQIRVHLAAIGHSVVGDGAYGGHRNSLVMSRPFLHAAGLRFRHPVTGVEVSVESELPGDLETVLTHCS